MRGGPAAPAGVRRYPDESERRGGIAVRCVLSIGIAAVMGPPSTGSAPMVTRILTLVKYSELLLFAAGLSLRRSEAKTYVCVVQALANIDARLSTTRHKSPVPILMGLNTYHLLKAASDPATISRYTGPIWPATLISVRRLRIFRKNRRLRLIGYRCDRCNLLNWFVYREEVERRATVNFCAEARLQVNNWGTGRFRNFGSFALLAS
jgi:hypothetical protein